VLTIVGSTCTSVLNLMLQAQFGTTTRRRSASPSRTSRRSPSSRARSRASTPVLSVEPAAQGAVNSGQLVNLLRNDGTTGPAYDGPEGKGEGHKIASFAKTPFAPEAYYPHRIWWVAREEFLQKNPKAVTRS
jgi:hypothetical protein